MASTPSTSSLDKLVLFLDARQQEDYGACSWLVKQLTLLATPVRILAPYYVLLPLE
jgi:hypothetical protein